jgi:hypothetical protein
MPYLHVGRCLRYRASESFRIIFQVFLLLIAGAPPCFIVWIIKHFIVSDVSLNFSWLDEFQISFQFDAAEVQSRKWETEIRCMKNKYIFFGHTKYINLYKNVEWQFWRDSRLHFERIAIVGPRCLNVERLAKTVPMKTFKTLKWIIWKVILWSQKNRIKYYCAQ